MSYEPQNPEFPTPDGNEISGGTSPGAGQATGTLPPPQPAAPVQTGYRRNRPALVLGLIAAVLATALLALVGFVVFAVAAVAAVASGEVEIETSAVEITIDPATLADLPAAVVEEKGEITIDLTSIDTADWASADEPVELDLDVDYGSITVIVPEGIDVDVDASVDLGQATVFGDSANGFNNDIERRAGEAAGSQPNLELDVDLGVGSIEVTRG